MLCYMEPNCVSYNFMKRVGPENHVCELNNSTDERHKGDLMENLSYLYHEAKVRKCNPTEISSGK